MGRSENPRSVWWGVLVFGATLAAYFPALSAGFIWNDRDYVTSPGLRSLDGLARIWFEVGATEQFYPLLHTAFWIEHRLWGDAALGYHLVNVLLHATSACLLALILRRLFNPRAAACPAISISASGSASIVGAGPERPRYAGVEWLAAVVFALHPIGVESVAWISEQKNTLSTVLYLAAAFAYLRFEEKRIASRYGLASALFAMALLTKSVTATLPAALLVIHWWRQGRLEWKRDVVPLIPWLMAGAIVGLFTGWVEKEIGGAKGMAFHLTFVERLLLAGRAVWFYLGKLIWPVNLIFIYPRWNVSAGVVWQYLYPVGAAALVVALWFVRRRRRGPLAAILFFVGSLFPVLGFFNVYAFVFSFVADHWQYLPSIGIIVLAAAGTVELFERAPPSMRWPSRTRVAVTVALLGLQTWRQSRTYHDIETFYRTIIERNPACWMAHYNLGNVLRSTGRFEEAIVHYEQALQANAEMADAQTALGIALQQTGRGGEAITHFEQALRLDPNYADAHNYLGLVLAKAGRRQDAIGHYEQALRINPALAEVHNNLGNTLRAEGRLPEAMARYELALRLKPDFAEAHNNLGYALSEADRLPEAIVHYEQALRINSALPQVHSNLGMVLLMVGRTPEAIAHFERALQLDPNLSQVHTNLAMALESVGRSREAASQYEAARRLESGISQPSK